MYIYIYISYLLYSHKQITDYRSLQVSLRRMKQCLRSLQRGYEGGGTAETARRTTLSLSSFAQGAYH